MDNWLPTLFALAYSIFTAYYLAIKLKYIAHFKFPFGINEAILIHLEANIHLFEYPSKEPKTLTDPQKPQNIGACPDLSEKQNKERFTCFQMRQEQILLQMTYTDFRSFSANTLHTVRLPSCIILTLTFAIVPK